jgi:hypothetical protein
LQRGINHQLQTSCTCQESILLFGPSTSAKAAKKIRKPYWRARPEDFHISSKINPTKIKFQHFLGPAVGRW